MNIMRTRAVCVLGVSCLSIKMKRATRVCSSSSSSSSSSRVNERILRSEIGFALCPCSFSKGA
jgi:hypothetical protein